MIQSVEDLAHGAIQLPPDQRFILAQRILESVEPDQSEEIDEAWQVEIRKRINQYDGGETKGIPAEQVFSEIDRRILS